MKQKLTDYLTTIPLVACDWSSMSACSVQHSVEITAWFAKAS